MGFVADQGFARHNSLIQRRTRDGDSSRCDAKPTANPNCNAMRMPPAIRIA